MLMDGGTSGVDKIACAVVWDDLDPSAWDTSRLDQGELTSVTTTVRPGGWDGAAAQFRAKFIGENPHLQPGWYGAIEWNPSRVVDPDGYSLAGVQVLDDQWRQVRQHALDLGGVRTLDADPKLTRLDLARDFGEVGGMGQLLDSLARLPVPHCKRTNLWLDGSEGGALTLVRGSGEGLIRSYDQGVAKKDRGAPKGLLRVELQARSRWLARADSGTLQAAKVKAVEVYRNRWEWARMGTRVESTAAVRDRADSLMQQEKFSRAVTLRCFGEMMWQASGGVVPEGSKNSAAQYNKWLQEMGITLARDGRPQVPTGRLTTALDLDSGRALTAAA